MNSDRYSNGYRHKGLAVLVSRLNYRTSALSLLVLSLFSCLCISVQPI